MEPCKKQWKGSYENSRQYNSKWEKEFSWLTKGSHGDAYCKNCQCTVASKHSNIKQHERSEKHKRKAPAQNQKMLDVISKPGEPKISDDVKSAELQLAAAMACHCSISAIDHLGEIIVKYGQGSTIGNIKIHRTKCANLIKNVLSPSLKEVVISNFKNKKYCIIVDEFTDVSTYKHLCILVRFFSDQLNAVSTFFLALVYVHEATAENIFNLIEEEIKKCNQTLENCLGFASDGASTMIGCNNSVGKDKGRITYVHTSKICVSFFSPLYSKCCRKITIEHCISSL
ncbi:Zinc finger mym-type protein 1 [Plakobranchus ocellatus]|uniref:Zinc finger mym-type protein 1 n=1 Tax=Plakobranchus ocellatus TaxID=259542 RepID=A0AAV4BQC4_9GAST|nr:Zinc finger mym-type protein 1 [Plakobranchus ocellatus]